MLLNIVVDMKLFNDMLVRRATTSEQCNIHVLTHKIQMHLHGVYYFNVKGRGEGWGDRQALVGPHGHDSTHRHSLRVVLGAGCRSLRVVVGAGHHSLRVLLVAGGGEKTSARGKGGACDVWTEQVREPHLNNTHTHTFTHYTCAVLRVQGSQGIKKYPNVLFSRINFIDLFTNFCV